MYFWNVIAKCDLLIPLLMLIGAPLLKRSANNIENSVFGYKSKRAKETPDTWYFANTYAAGLWQKWGEISIVGSAIAAVVLFFLKAEVSIWPIILMGVQLAILLSTLLATEHALKEKLDKGEKLRP